MIKLVFPTTAEDFAAEQERITGRPTPENGMKIFEAWVPVLNILYDCGTQNDFDFFQQACDVLSQARGRINISPELKHLIDVLGTWAAEAYIQGREA